MLNSIQLVKPWGIDVFVVKNTESGPQYLLIRRCSKYLCGNWQMVSGKSEKDETAWQTAIREIFEETGLRIKTLYSADFINTFYEARRDTIMLLPVFVAFVEENQEVRLSPTEHDEYKWLTYDEALTYLEFDAQKKALTHIKENFIDNEPNKWLLITL